jgi:hypothetical protein
MAFDPQSKIVASAVSVEGQKAKCQTQWPMSALTPTSEGDPAALFPTAARGQGIVLRKASRSAIMVMPAFTKIVLGEMRASGVRGVSVYCTDYRCGHSTHISADQWSDDVRLSDLILPS